jgi:hypothetical protein
MPVRFNTFEVLGSALIALNLFAANILAESTGNKLAANLERARAAMANAEKTGAAFVIGKDTTLTDEKLFGKLKDDPKVWNVVFERTFRDEKGRMKVEQRLLYPARTNIRLIDYGSNDEPDPKSKDNARYNYGFIMPESQPLIRGIKKIKSDDEKVAPSDGVIIVLMVAEWDTVFKNAHFFQGDK